jgi:hypothetical protein
MGFLDVNCSSPNISHLCFIRQSVQRETIIRCQNKKTEESSKETANTSCSTWVLRNDVLRSHVCFECGCGSVVWSVDREHTSHGHHPWCDFHPRLHHSNVLASLVEMCWSNWCLECRLQSFVRDEIVCITKLGVVRNTKIGWCWRGSTSWWIVYRWREPRSGTIGNWRRWRN